MLSVFSVVQLIDKKVTVKACNMKTLIAIDNVILYGQLLLIFVANRLLNKDHFNGEL
jgi:hypothetical protein